MSSKSAIIWSRYCYYDYLIYSFRSTVRPFEMASYISYVSTNCYFSRVVSVFGCLFMFSQSHLLRVTSNTIKSRKLNPNVIPPNTRFKRNACSKIRHRSGLFFFKIPIERGKPFVQTIKYHLARAAITICVTLGDLQFTRFYIFALKPIRFPPSTALWKTKAWKAFKILTNLRFRTDLHLRVYDRKYEVRDYNISIGLKTIGTSSIIEMY